VQIHVVKNGESLYSIANKYSVKVDEIIVENKLEEPAFLVDGQAIVIPVSGEYYFVKNGDSLESIAHQFGLTAQELADINEFPTNDSPPVGLRLYIPSQFE